MRMVGFFEMRERVARRVGEVGGAGAILGMPFEGGSTFWGVRIWEMGSGMRVQSLTYFSSRVLSWSESCGSEDSDVGGVPFMAGASEGLGKAIRFKSGCAASISARRCFRRLAAI